MKWLKKVAATPLTSIARVVDSLNNSTNDRTNAPSIHAVREAVNNNWLNIYPIGSIYMSVNNVNPSTMFGGTWQQIKDRFLLACGDTYNNGATGGEANHTLTANEMPSHNHSYTKATGVDGHTLTTSEMPSHGHVYNAVWIDDSTTESDTGQLEFVWQVHQGENDQTLPIIFHQRSEEPFIETHAKGGGGSHNHGLSSATDNTGNKGGGTSHNNMPPYLAVNVWVRTA